jgi:hypothetical protein
MKLFIKITIIGLLISATQSFLFSQKFYIIPSQNINLLEMTGTDEIFMSEIKEFQISEFVTLAEYKAFLTSIKKDSSETYYLKMLPDSAIALTTEIYTAYLSKKKYEKYPVLGVKWDSAIEFCKWKSNKNVNSSEFYYSLPNASEWLAAYTYLSKNGKENDFNKKYSDMTLSSYDESAYFYYKSKDQTLNRFNYSYNHHPDDPPSLKRKRIAGSSYVFEMNTFFNNTFYIYSYEGYRYVSFRIVKHKK